jgi:hypothetical protein
LLEHKPPTDSMSQVVLAGRRVGYFSLTAGLPFGTHDDEVRFIELADRKPDHTDSPGFHHVELYPRVMAYDEFLQLMNDAGFRPVLRPREHHTTHDISVADGPLLRLTNCPLIKRIAREQLARP